MPETLPCSVVVLTHNRRDLLRENLLSVRAQTVKPAEIVVVDNNSSDGASEMVKTEFPEVRLIRVDYDSGVEGFNIGIENAREDAVGVLDDDTTVPPDWLAGLYAKLSAEPPDTLIVSPKVVEPGMPQELLDSPALNTERYVDLFEGSSFMARRKELVALGMFPKEFFIYGNERDVAARAAIAGYKIRFCPSVKSFHKKPYGVRLGRQNLFLISRNYTWLLLKYYSASDIARTLFHILKNALARRDDHAGLGMDTRATEGFNRAFKPANLWYAFSGFTAAVLRVDYWLKNRQVVRKKGFTLLFDTWRLKE
ncbi:MAG TPA: glycosyltransferase family 2 protein [Elusimicrobiota bacterium]|nr:glycosyltransferase family 2 protein [Elusimicrobiota bacterium]